MFHGREARDAAARKRGLGVFDEEPVLCRGAFVVDGGRGAGGKERLGRREL